MQYTCGVQMHCGEKYVLGLQRILHSLIEGQLQSHLYVGIWTHPLFLDKLFPVRFKRVHIHVQISHQPDNE